MLDFTGGPSIMRGFDGVMVMLYGAYKVHGAVGKLWGAFSRSSIDWAPLTQFLQKGGVSSVEGLKLALAECFKFVEAQELLDASYAAVYGISAMLLGFMMILLSAVLWSGKTVILPLTKVLMGMYLGSLILSLSTLYTSATQSYKLWVFHSELKQRLLSGNLAEALLLLQHKIEPSAFKTGSDIDAELLESGERELNILIASGALKEKLRACFTELEADPDNKGVEIVELMQEILDDNVKQRTIHAVKIMLGLWGVLYTVVGLITTGGVANIALNALAWSVSFAVLSCFAWFAVDNEPIADMVGNAGVWLAQKYDELLIKRTFSIALFSGLVKAGDALHMDVDYLNQRLKAKELELTRLKEVQQRLHRLCSKQGKVHYSEGSNFENNQTKEELRKQTKRDLNGAWSLVVDGKTRFAPSMDCYIIDDLLQELEEEFKRTLTGDKANEIAVTTLGAVAQTNYVPPTLGLIQQFGVTVSQSSSSKFLAHIKTKGDNFQVQIDGQLALYEATSQAGKIPLAEVKSEVHINIPKNGGQATMTWNYSISKINHLGFSILSNQHLNSLFDGFIYLIKQ